MTEEILVNHTAHETRIAVVQQGVVQELHLERAATRGLVGNVYLGKVSRVLPGMQSAFIDIGLERAAFLHVADLWQSRSHSRNGAGHPMPIEKLLFEGQPLLVQVIKDPLGTKGARLSTQISIAGRLLVYLPQDPHIGVSQRIERRVRARSCCAPGCRSCCRPTSAAASSSAPRPRTRSTPSSRPTSPTCAGAGARSSTTASASPRPRCCTRS